MSVLSTSAKSLARQIDGKIVMSGIQPTGVFHLGNLLGAVDAWRQLAASSMNAKEVVYMIADLHSLTVAKPAEMLRELRWQALASLLACGLDPLRCNLYFQSKVEAHTQLHWLLSSVSSMGYLSRMTQWKSKSGLDSTTSINHLANNSVPSNLGDVNLALFSYPVLQAADVLINNADIVPVGEDQAQHLELTRHIAGSYNFRYGSKEFEFSLPQTVLTPFKKVLSLRDPLKKMSKSDPDANSCIYITDSPESVASKLKRAVTDSIQGPILEFDPVSRPAVSNLVLIASGLLHLEPQEFLDQYKPQDHRHLKETVAEIVTSVIGPINKEYERLITEKFYLEEVAVEGSLRANERCSAIYEKAAYNVGL